MLGGERGGDPLPGFDLGNSPLEYLEPRAETLVLTTTNGTRAMVQAAANCDLVLVGSMLNLEAVAAAARERGEDVEVVCAGLRGGYSEDDAYCAGRIAALVGGEPTAAAERALELAASLRDRRGGVSHDPQGRRDRRRGRPGLVRAGERRCGRFLASTACAARPRA